MWHWFSRGFTQTTADRFCWLDWRQRGSMHGLIDDFRKHEPQRFLLHNAVSVWHSENAEWPSLPQYPRQPAATWSCFTCTVSISKLVFLVPRTTLLNLCRMKVPNGEPRICRDWPIASNNVSPFGSVCLACGFGNPQIPPTTWKQRVYGRLNLDAPWN